jgi:glycosyltransferase involved in cell wall biosynthesis
MRRAMPVEARYVLVTAAYNEERYIEELLKSVIAQTLLPLRWVIVSDGSTDRTEAIVRQYASQFDFIELFRIDDDHPRNFAAQVHAINAGLARLNGLDFDFVANADADVSFDSTYISDLLAVFATDPRLGLAGGSIFEKQDGEFKPRSDNRELSVAHAAQCFRRECFESLGACYLALPYGGSDTYAEIRSRMNGWRVRSIAALRVFHHRPMGGASGWIRGTFRQGRMDHSLGIHPLFEIGRLMQRLSSRPFVVYAGVRLAGFCFSYIVAEERMVSSEFMNYLRHEETERVRQLLRKRLLFAQSMKDNI